MSEMQRAADKTRNAAGGSMAMLDFATKWHEEMLRFCGLRMNRYFELSSRFWECKNPGDVYKLQAGFLQKMLADYKAETDLVCGQLLSAGKLATSERSGLNGPSSYEAAVLNAQRDAAKIIDLAKDQAARILNKPRHGCRRRRKCRN